MKNTVVKGLKEQVEEKIAFILSSLDRDPFSKTSGCFDRLFWAWKLKDFPDATLQRMVYPLVAYYYRVDNSFCEKEIFLSWIMRSFEYLTKIQHKDGSFDQAFPNEHSHGATAFLLYDLARAYQMMNADLNTSEKASIVNILEAMGHFLIRNDEKHGIISNHLLGAAAALEALYSLTENVEYRKRASYYLERVFSNQSPEGWFLEYGGADPGYQTLAIYYLAQYYLETGEKNALLSLEKAIDFISFFIHPDGSFGGEYGSRNTEILYPGGLAIVADQIPLAKSILRFMIDKIETGKTVALESVDVGNISPLIGNYLEVILREAIEKGKTGHEIPFKRDPFTKEFKDAGLVIYNGESNYAVIGISKGGVIKEFDKLQGARLRDDCGYIGKLRIGELVSTQRLCKPTYKLAERRLSIWADFYQMKQHIPDPYKFLVLRVLNLTLGKLHFFRETMKKLFVKTLIMNSKKIPFRVLREIAFDSPLEVTDRIEPEGSVDRFLLLEHGIKFSTIHMASAKYWHYQ
jgi:hypothetical protein